MKSRKDEYFSPHLRRHTRHKSAFPQLWWHKPDQILSLDSCMAETSLPDPNKKMSADLMVRSDNELLSYLALALAKGFAIGLWRASEYNLLISQKLWSLPVSACGRTRVLLSCSARNLPLCTNPQLRSPHHLALALLLAPLIPGPSAHLPTLASSTFPSGLSSAWRCSNPGLFWSSSLWEQRRWPSGYLTLKGNDNAVSLELPRRRCFSLVAHHDCLSVKLCTFADIFGYSNWSQFKNQRAPFHSGLCWI